MRDNPQIAMQRMPSLMESRHRLLHSRASLERESIQPRYPPITLDLLSIPNYVIKKRLPHGHRYGKTEEQVEHILPLI